MIFTLLLFHLSFVSVALPADPQLGARLARRRGSHLGLNLARVPTDAEPDVEYDRNWAGIVLSGPKGSFTSVTGTFIVPTPSGTSGYAATTWVGIDGRGCGQAIFQTGVDMTITDEGTSYDAWYEWFPDISYDFPDITVHSGDVITTNVTALSTNSGLAIIENHTTGQVVTKALQSSYALCGTAAEWIVEDFEEGVDNHWVPFADFGTVTFKNATAAGPGGTHKPCGELADLELTIMDIQVNEEALTSSVVEGCDVVIKYV